MFCPSQDAPDSVRCFTCNKFLDGWEPNDDPLEEHKKHSKDCKFVWAVTEHEDQENAASAKAASKAVKKPAASSIADAPAETEACESPMKVDSVVASATPLESLDVNIDRDQIPPEQTLQENLRGHREKAALMMLMAAEAKMQAFRDEAAAVRRLLEARVSAHD